MSKQPNFIMIVSDQQRADWLGCAGHPVINTPNIDALAADGVRFSEFHTASPVCMPNRASILTGRYPSVHGLRYNGCALTSRANTFVEVLKAAGYKTAAIGKSHLQPFTANPVDRPKHLVEGYNDQIPEAWKDTYEPYVHEEPERYKSEELYDFPTPYYGFDYVDMVTDHGVKCGGHYLQWLRKQSEEADQLRNPEVQFDHNYTVMQANRTTMPEELYPTRYIENQVLDWLRDHGDEEQPYFLFVSFPDPHHPFNPPGKYWDRYQPEQFSVDNPIDGFTNPPPILDKIQEQMAQGTYPTIPQEAVPVSERHCQEAMALSAGMMDMIDDAVGSITKALSDSSQGGNTIVIYTADHGDYMGDANLLLKGPWMRNSIHQVPFIWKDPQGEKGVVTDLLGSSIDIAPTVLARAGVAPFYGIQGRNLLADLVIGEGRSDLLIEHNDSGIRMGFSQPSRSRTLYRKDWRLTIYPGEDWGELYHTVSDPKHINNLWASIEHSEIKLELMQQLALQLTATMDESPRSIRRA